MHCKVCNTRITSKKSRDRGVCSAHDMGKYEDEPDRVSTRYTRKCLRGHTEISPGNDEDTKYCQVEVQTAEGTEKCGQIMRSYP